VDLTALEDGLSSLGFRDLRQFVGGWQSLAVYEAMLDGRRVVVKVLDSRFADRAALGVRLDLLSRLGAVSDVVCAPIPVDGRFLHEITTSEVHPVYAVAYDFAEGDAPDIDQPKDVTQMGRMLAGLHASMATLPLHDLPTLAAFPPRAALGRVADDLGVSRTALPETTLDDGERRQLLHGDFSSKNVRVAGASWRVFDFDDCGYGSVELDLANSLYFVLFDAVTGRNLDRYLRFREAFLGGYRDRSGVGAADQVLDTLITLRVLTLASWLADPANAAPGVRTASAEWRTTLETFVRTYLGMVGLIDVT